MEIIGYIHTDYKEKFGIPRQSGIVNENGSYIVFEPKYRQPEAFRGLDEFSHIWLLWIFSKATNKEFAATVKPPKLGGNKRMGVFATRSPFRPNNIGLSSVRLTSIEYTETEGPILHIEGADLLDGTPIIDIKPYLPYTDSHLDASGGWTDQIDKSKIKVSISKELLELIPKEKQDSVIDMLKADPRPGYQSDPERLYGIAYDCFDIRFKVCNDLLTVVEVERK